MTRWLLAGMYAAAILLGLSFVLMALSGCTVTHVHVIKPASITCEATAVKRQVVCKVETRRP